MGNKCDVKGGVDASNRLVYSLINEGVNDLIQDSFQNHEDFESPVRSSDSVLYAVSEERDIIGVLCYRNDITCNSILITLGYVEHSSRRTGVMTKLFNELISITSTMGFDHISTIANANNTALLLFLSRSEFKPRLIRYEYTIPYVEGE